MSSQPKEGEGEGEELQESEIEEVLEEEKPPAN
jgi:hypothetical protein